AVAHLRSAPRLLATRPRLSPGRQGAGRLRRGPRLHPHRAAPRRRASLHRLLGLSGDGVLRADGALRAARALPLLPRPPHPSDALLRRAAASGIAPWDPDHSPRYEWALARCDATARCEQADPRQGEHPDWGTLVFNYDRNEVRNFLVANALYWFEEFHVDGLRVDAVASMLYLDSSRKPGQWVPNRLGGRENLGALEFIRELNTVVFGAHPGVMMIAEESTAWPMVTRPVDHGGLGFSHKWNMGWMHDTLDYFRHDPVHRRDHPRDVTLGLLYAFSENFVLPLSHDEVVHGKGALLDKMPGDEWQQFANLRALYGWMWAHPGAELLFMGGEIAQWREWSVDTGVDWRALE